MSAGSFLLLLNKLLITENIDNNGGSKLSYKFILLTERYHTYYVLAPS